MSHRILRWGGKGTKLEDVTRCSLGGTNGQGDVARHPAMMTSVRVRYLINRRFGVPLPVSPRARMRSPPTPIEARDDLMEFAFAAPSSGVTP